MLDDRSGGEGSGEWLPASLDRPEFTNCMFFNGIFLDFASLFPGGLGLLLYAMVASGDPLAFRFLVKNY